MQSTSGSGEKYSGWAAFAGVLLFIIGSLNAIWGLAAVLDDEVVIVGGHGALIGDVALWGVVHMILGAVIAATGAGLFAGNSAARVPAILLVSLNAIAQIVWFPAAPLWSFLVILLDVMIIYQLTARWDRQAGWNN